jgi:hypothetical protein
MRDCWRGGGMDRHPHEINHEINSYKFANDMNNTPAGQKPNRNVKKTRMPAKAIQVQQQPISILLSSHLAPW